MKNIVLKVEYDGTNYAGFQIQPKLKTIQGELEKAISKTLRQEIKIVAAGRTDVGVHALGQVINFKCNTDIDIGNLPKVVNYNLPDDISVVGAKYERENFSARFDAKAKVYRYYIYNSRYRSAIYNKYSFNYPHKLNLKRMKDASKILIGTHDFTSFMGRDSDVKDAIRTLYEINIEQNGDFFILDFYGKSFLRNMIRIMVGSLVEIGRGKKEIEFLENALKEKKRESAGYTAPSCGLFLMKVIY